jgi:hypothetical protein
MKNIAIPLLVAGSAQAQTAADTGAPLPWLGSDSVKNVCVDKAATDKTAWTNATTAVDGKIKVRDGAGGDTGKVAAAKTAMDKALAAAKTSATDQKVVIKAANDAAELLRNFEAKEYDAFVAKTTNTNLTDDLKAASKLRETAWTTAKGMLTDYVKSVSDAEAHLKREEDDLVIALCRLQPAAALVGTDNKSKTW